MEHEQFDVNACIAAMRDEMEWQQKEWLKETFRDLFEEERP